ncbi:hypothetical protein [Flavobacterium sp. UBA7680]|uniref:hypothetical protein n=1 Tax=Flavobacterium sp. UBA7680 TaxID=1946559 RepID=UPI0025BE5FAF|nr:hypothetical protein [Flavobacterium sp. UBA7680]
MKKKLFILISILAISCNNDKTDTQTDKTSINLITGINLRETSDDSELQLQFGNPNILTNNKFLIYPNPVNESVNILAQENVTDVWLVSANPEKIYQDVNFNNILNTNLYSEQSIISHSIFSSNKQSSKNFSINISSLAKGYYKVFIKIGGIIYWDNLYKYENGGDNEEQFNTIKNFWTK